MIDTIYALASPNGRSGVAVLRISGPKAYDAASLLTGCDHFESRKAYLCGLYDFRQGESRAMGLAHNVSRETASSCVREGALIGDLIDQGLVIAFKAPASFTGEDVVELQPHGSPAVL